MKKKYSLGHEELYAFLKEVNDVKSTSAQALDLYPLRTLCKKIDKFNCKQDTYDHEEFNGIKELITELQVEDLFKSCSSVLGGEIYGASEME